MISRMNSKRKLDTLPVNVHESKKIKNPCSNYNDDDDMKK